MLTKTVFNLVHQEEASSFPGGIAVKNLPAQGPGEKGRFLGRRSPGGETLNSLIFLKRESKGQGLVDYGPYGAKRTTEATAAAGERVY